MTDQQTRDLSHQVWDVYDELRTARLNVKYYSAKLARIKKANTTIEVILAIAAPSSAIAGLWFWNTQVGHWAWQYLACLAALIAILKPIINLVDTIQKYEEKVIGFRQFENDLDMIKLMISQKRKYDAKTKLKFAAVLEKKARLKEKPLELRPDKKLIHVLMEEIKLELPNENFFIPKAEVVR